MKAEFNKRNSRALHLRRNSPIPQYILGATQVESRLPGMDLKALEFRCQGTALPLLSALGRPNGECCVRVWTPQNTETLERVPQRLTKMVKGLEHLPCEEWLGELGLLRLKRRLRGILSMPMNT